MNKINWPKWPQYGQEEKESVVRVIESNQLFADKEVKEFEEQYSRYVGTKYALGVGNATEGLHLSLAALNIGVGDEVIVTPYSFISSASCVLMQNAIPIFCDIEEESLGLCPNDLVKKISERTKAIIVVHMFGYPANIIEIMNIANKHNIVVIEDASHAHGASVDNVKIGTFGEISVFSLHQRKALSVGDGGVICTNNTILNNKMYKLRSFGHNELSYNYRMTEFAGALGKVQLLKMDLHNKVRVDNALYLSELLKDNPNLKVRTCRENEYGVYYAVLIEIIGNSVSNISEKIKKIESLGIQIRETFVQPALHKHPHFNPKEIPARGLPWKDNNYNGLMKDKEYKNLSLPNSDTYCSSKLIELYVHPPVDRRLIKYAAKAINDQFL
jgi:perosamine synthetase